MPVSDNQAELDDDVRAAVAPVHGFAPVFMPNGTWPKPGALMKQPALARTLKRLAEAGLEDFYRGDLAKTIAADLAKAGSPLVADDLARHKSRERAPISIMTSKGTIYNFPPPTQGVVALLILGQFDRLNIREAEGFDHLHALIEASKQAYKIRDRIVGDPDYMKESPDAYLTPAYLDKLTAGIDMKRAKPAHAPTGAGDTAWMGAIDGAGRAASHIQSVFHPFGSGVVLNETGIVWQNRGASFSLDPKAVNPVMPGRKPFPHLESGDGQIEGRTIRHLRHDGRAGAAAIFFGRVCALCLVRSALPEGDHRAALVRRWHESADGKSRRSCRGHATAQRRPRDRIDRPFITFMGHAHGIALHPDGTLEGGVDPRSDGTVGAY